MYDDSHRYDHATCSFFDRFYNCADQCELFWRGDGICYSDGYGWHGSIYIWLEYDTGADGGYRYRSCCWNLYGADYGCGRLYDNCHGYDYAACCGAGSQYHGDYQRKLLWWFDGFCYGDGYGRHGSLYL